MQNDKRENGRFLKKKLGKANERLKFLFSKGKSQKTSTKTENSRNTSVSMLYRAREVTKQIKPLEAVVFGR